MKVGGVNNLNAKFVRLIKETRKHPRDKDMKKKLSALWKKMTDA